MILSELQFRNRFSIEEKRRIYDAAKVSVDVQIFLDDLAAVDAAVGVDTEDLRTVGGVYALAAYGMLDHENRPAEILAGDGSGGDAEQITLTTDQPCAHDGNWTVVEGGTFDASSIIEVVNTKDSAQKVGYSARFIATGEN